MCVQNTQTARDAHITPKDAARLLGVSVPTIRRHAARLGRKQFGRWLLDPQRVADVRDGQAVA